MHSNVNGERQKLQRHIRWFCYELNTLATSFGITQNFEILPLILSSQLSTEIHVIVIYIFLKLMTILKMMRGCYIIKMSLPT